MVLARQVCSRFKLPRTNPLSPLSTTAVQLHEEEDSEDVEVLQSSVVVVQEVVFRLNVVVVALSRELADQALLPAEEVVNKVTITDSKVDEVEGAVAGSVGKTMTSLSGIAMLVSMFDLTGRCWKRLTSTVFPS